MTGAVVLDEDKIDDAVLALLRLKLHDERRSWDELDWVVLDRKGLIGDPVGKVKSVVLTGDQRAHSAVFSANHCDRRVGSS